MTKEAKKPIEPLTLREKLTAERKRKLKVRLERDANRRKKRTCSGPAVTERRVARNHDTRWRHRAMTVDDAKAMAKEVFTFAKPGCRHCYGTGFAGARASVGNKDIQPLVCACVQRRMAEYAAEEAKEAAGAPAGA